MRLLGRPQNRTRSEQTQDTTSKRAVTQWSTKKALLALKFREETKRSGAKKNNTSRLPGWIKGRASQQGKLVGTTFDFGV